MVEPLTTSCYETLPGFEQKKYLGHYIGIKASAPVPRGEQPTTFEFENGNVAVSSGAMIHGPGVWGAIKEITCESPTKRARPQARRRRQTRRRLSRRLRKNK